MEKIDFILTWVDGSDLKWRSEKQKWEVTTNKASSLSVEANADCRYRSDDRLLRYWFRGVEKFAPWVNRVFFVTCGQKPEWLNENNPKLVLMNHEDYIPFEYLPTFNSNVIELNYHRIKDLSETFVLFNDDMFLLQPIEPSYFFCKGNPKLNTDLRYPNYVGHNNWSRFLFNDYCVVNRSFDIRKSIWNQKRKWFNVKELGVKRARQNIVCYIANKTLPVGIYGHLALPHLKSSIQELWNQHPDIMDCTCRHKFRSDDQVNQYLLCAWNQAKGCFYPVHEKGRGKQIEISPQSIDEIIHSIKNGLYPQVCLNDSPLNTDEEICMDLMMKAFDAFLPDKSSFEKR